MTEETVEKCNHDGRQRLDISDVELLEFLVGYGSNNNSGNGCHYQYSNGMQYEEEKQSLTSTSDFNEVKGRRGQSKSESDCSLVEKWEPGEIVSKRKREMEVKS